MILYVVCASGFNGIQPTTPNCPCWPAKLWHRSVHREGQGAERKSVPFSKKHPPPKKQTFFWAQNAELHREATYWLKRFYRVSVLVGRFCCHFCSPVWAGPQRLNDCLCNPIIVANVSRRPPFCKLPTIQEACPEAGEIPNTRIPQFVPEMHLDGRLNLEVKERFRSWDALCCMTRAYFQWLVTCDPWNSGMSNPLIPRIPRILFMMFMYFYHLGSEWIRDPNVWGSIHFGNWMRMLCRSPSRWIRSKSQLAISRQ